MRMTEYLDFAGTEVANSARTTTYERTLGGIPGLTLAAACPCDIIDEGYVSPAADPAPWYLATRAESEEFYGFYAHSIVAEPVMGRAVTSAGRYGSVVSPARFKGRQLQVSGTMVATSQAGQAYGERWLAEVLRGSACDEGNCVSDDACVIPACPQDPYDAAAAYRTLVDVGVVDGPVFTTITEVPECYLQQVSFLVVSSMPWFYHPTERCLEDEPITDAYYGSPTSCALTAPEWIGDGTFVIDITAISAVTDLVITGRVSLDGDCPVAAPGDSVMPCFTYTIPAMEADDRLVIDGMRRKASYYDASDKFAKPLLPYTTFEGPWKWPDVAPCTTVCLTLEVGSGDAEATVDTALREI